MITITDPNAIEINCTITESNLFATRVEKNIIEVYTSGGDEVYMDKKTANKFIKEFKALVSKLEDSVYNAEEDTEDDASLDLPNPNDL